MESSIRDEARTSPPISSDSNDANAGIKSGIKAIPVRTCNIAPFLITTEDGASDFGYFPDNNGQYYKFLRGNGGRLGPEEIEELRVSPALRQSIIDGLVPPGLDPI